MYIYHFTWEIAVAIIITLFITTFFGHLIHFILHQPWSGKVHQAHMTHHLKLYPPSDFLSDTYRQAGQDSTPKFFFFAAIPLILAPIILWACGVLPLSLMMVVLAVEALMGFLHNYLHDAFHIKGHWLSRWSLTARPFNHWVVLHRWHHRNMGVNYGIFSFLWDRVFGTFRKA